MVAGRWIRAQAPCITRKMHPAGSTAGLTRPWPVVGESARVQDSITLVVQVSGEVRGRVDVPADAGREAIESAVMAEDNVLRHMDGKTARKVIVVPGKLVNIVV